MNFTVEDSHDFFDQRSEWGVTLSETTSHRSLAGRAHFIGGYILLLLAAFLFLPVLAGLIFFPETRGIAPEIGVVSAIIGAGLFLKVRASRLPRNAVQIDYSASEIRLGSQKSDGTFIRQRVISFRDIDAVSVEHFDGAAPMLCLSTSGEDITMPFNGVDATNVEELASQIAEARDSALRAPVRSRIQSTMHSFGASIREVKSRVRSSIAPT